MARGWFFCSLNYLFAFFWRNLNGVKQALIDSLFYLTACIISGVVVIFLFIGFPILIIDWLLSAQLTQSEAFLTFTIKNPLKNILEIFFGSGFKGALYTFFVGMPLVYIIHRRRK